ncbi:uracil phosphoribosyltransferase [bacterium]|nr:uracil phosphoribosyltransferase [bacterium]
MDTPKNLNVSNHPILQHNLATLRKKNSSPEAFRNALGRIFQIVFYEATKNIVLEEVEIETPITKTNCKVYSKDSTIIISPILRAGLSLADEAIKIIPQAVISHLGMYRDEQTLAPVWYYNKSYDINFNPKTSTIFLLDPMLATGNTLIEAIKNYISLNVEQENIHVVSIISSPEGVNNVLSAFPNVKVYTAALDEKLNEKGYIVPGLGDAGDRIFNTNH